MSGEPQHNAGVTLGSAPDTLDANVSLFVGHCAPSLPRAPQHWFGVIPHLVLALTHVQPGDFPGKSMQRTAPHRCCPIPSRIIPCT